MKILYFDTLPSTQTYLIQKIKTKEITAQSCIVAKYQKQGIGSRGNHWSEVENGLYFSFNLALDSLPKDLAIQSMGIFFAFIFKDLLEKKGSKIWLKYPNDLYLEKNKIGGVMCNIADGFAVCGIGLNLESSTFSAIESTISIQKHQLLEDFFSYIPHFSWQKVFAKYSKEFHKNYDFSFHYQNKYLSLKDSVLLKDGSIKINEEIFYSLR